jgi:hypothetical protein
MTVAVGHRGSEGLPFSLTRRGVLSKQDLTSCARGMWCDLTDAALAAPHELCTGQEDFGLC